MGFMIAFLGVFIYFVWRYIRAQGAQTISSWTAAAQQLGLEFSQDAGSKDPLISGLLDGHKVSVGMTLDAKSSARDPHRKLYRAGTKVEVATDSSLRFALIPRAEDNGKTPDGWKVWKSDLSEFDQKLVVWIPNDGGGLPAELCEALSETAVGLHVDGGRVFWWHPAIQKNADKLEETVRACVAVAEALQQHGGN